MPWQMIDVEAELHLEHKGVKIFRTYKDNNIEGIERTYSFVLDTMLGEEDDFDVREVTGWSPPKTPPILKGNNDTRKNKDRWNRYHKEGKLEKYIKEFLTKCINKGIITQDKVN